MNVPVLAWLLARRGSDFERPPPFTRRQARGVVAFIAVAVAAAIVRSALGA